jgi:RHS repeat-associated protein
VKTAYHGGLKSFDTQTNSAQAVVGQRLTDAFGNQISSSGVWKGRFAYGGPYGYQEDPDTGLRLLGHRYYDSSTGRFLTRDPIKSGDNWYVYCGSNPVSYQDATGLLEQSTGQMTQAQKDALDQMKALHGSDVSVTYDHAGKKVIVKKGNMTLEIDKNGKVTFVVTASSNDKSGKRSTTGKVSSSKGKTSVEVGVGVESGRFSAGASTTFTSDASGNSDVTMSWKGGYTIGGGSVSVGGKFGDPPGAQAGYKGKGWSGSFAVAPGSKPKGSLTFPLGKGGSVVIGFDPGKPTIIYGWKQ